MGCEDCEVRANVDGKSRHVRLWIENLQQVGTSTERSAVLYQCPTCKSLWEVCAYEKEPLQLDLSQAKLTYPNLVVSRI